MKTCLLGIAAFLAVAGTVNAAAVRTAGANPGFYTNTFAGNDDGSIGVALPFATNFFGTTYNSLFLNNNGNVTFDAPLGTFTPFPIVTSGRVILAPFFADVDTRGGLPDVTYGVDTVGGNTAIAFNWIDVGFFNQNGNARNTFQLVLIDQGMGDFCFEFNYDDMNWETGQASGGNANGLGGSSARVGFSDGVNPSLPNSLEFLGSAINGALLDGGPNALISGSFGSNIDGRYTFCVRNGTPVIPLPTAGAMGLAGLLGLGASRRRR